VKIFEEHKFSPICLSPGDTLKLTYQHPFSNEKTLATYVFDRQRVIDTAIIYELPREEAEALFLKDGIAIIIGEERF